MRLICINSSIRARASAGPKGVLAIQSVWRRVGRRRSVDVGVYTQTAATNDVKRRTRAQAFQGRDPARPEKNRREAAQQNGRAFAKQNGNVDMGVNDRWEQPHEQTGSQRIRERKLEEFKQYAAER